MNFDLTLIITCGIQGSGKSTWAEKFCVENPHFVYISSDKLRQQITGDMANQSANTDVYSSMYQKTRNALRFGKSTLVDATFVKKSWRKTIIKIGKEFGVKSIAHVFIVDKETAIKRIEQRVKSGGLNVPAEVIEKYISQFEMPDKNEFDEIIIHK